MTQARNNDTGRSRLTEVERQAMLDRLDANEEKNPAKQKRGMPRVAFRKNGVSIRIHHPGGSMSSSTVTTRNLSAGGVSFLYQGFLHKNTRIEIILGRRIGGEDIVGGTVQHCALVNKAFHLIGMRFDNKIFPKLYLDPSEWGVLEDNTPIDLSTLSGTILHIDEQEIDRMLFGHFLKGTRIKLISTATLADALVQVKDNKVDCAVFDASASGGELTTINKLRDAGFTGPVAILCADTSPARIRTAQAAGAGAVLGKPYEGRKLLSLLSTWLMAGASAEEPIYSTLADQPQMAPLIEQYVSRLHMLGRDLRKQIDAKSLDGLRQICQTIKGTGAGFGFGSISDLARDAAQSLDATRSVRDALGLLQQLESSCRRSTAKVQPTAAAPAAPAAPATPAAAA